MGSMSEPCGTPDACPGEGPKRPGPLPAPSPRN